MQYKCTNRQAHKQDKSRTNKNSFPFFNESVESNITSLAAFVSPKSSVHEIADKLLN